MFHLREKCIALFALQMTVLHLFVQRSQQCKIHILDYKSIFRIGREMVPDCNLNDPKFWPFQTEGKGLEGYSALPHNNSQHSGSYYFVEYLKNSPLHTSRIEDADYVFVDQYCLYMWWLATKRSVGLYHTDKQEQTNVENTLIKLLKILFNLPRWRRSNGRDFIFYFASPVSFTIYKNLWCDSELANSVHILPELNTFCTSKRHFARVVVAPHVTATSIPKTVPASRDRKNLLFYTGGCFWSDQRSVGQRMRWYIAHVLNQASSDVVARCSCGNCPGRVEHSEMMQQLQDSKFCLALPGDTQCSRRISESILAGCIPVFIGPPFHALPLAFTLDWARAGLFYYVSNTPWVTNPEEDSTNLRTWCMYTDLSGIAMNVKSISSVLRHLRSLPDKVVQQYQDYLLTIRSAFMYNETTKPDLTAPGLMASRICDMV